METVASWFDSDAERERAADDVGSLTPACRKVLGDLIETQGKTVERLSACLERLGDLGFAFERGGPYQFAISPTLWGEEAYALREERRDATAKRRRPRGKGDDDGATR